jgi:2'-5' RNA ligase
MAVRTYHLWLKPSGETYNLLAHTIHELARGLGAPVFEPHITLLSNLDGTEGQHRQRSEELVERLHPFPIGLIAASCGNEYFQCVFLKVDQTPPIMGANALARLIFSQPHDGYFPHLSLAYGLYPEARKAEVAASLPSSVCTSFEAADLYLIRADSTDPGDWHEVGVFSMSASSGSP